MATTSRTASRLVPPLKWHGGKHYLAERIVALMPPHLHYVEPYCGGAAVLLARDPNKDWLGNGTPSHLRGGSETINDIDGCLTNFWRCLQGPRSFEQFCRRVDATPFSEVEWNDAADCRPKCELDVEAAAHFFVLCRQSRAGQFRDFATLTRNRTRRRMNEQASAWLSCVEGLPAVHARLKRVAVLNRPALDVIRQQDGPHTLFYCDPPYVHETRTAPSVYAHEMSEAAHRKLLETIRHVEGKVMLSGYANTMYDEILSDWTRHDFELPNNAAGGKSKRRMTESVWCNF